MRKTSARIALALLCLVIAGAATPAGATTVRLFNTGETQGSNMAFFPQFTDMLRRYAADLPKANEPCSGGVSTPCVLRQWSDFIVSLRGLDRRTQIERVNSYMNDIDYVEDSANWGSEDYWATPVQFFTRAGDCEDYAIAKYLTLRALGVPISAMRIVVLQDRNLGLAHAILVVYDNGTPLVLDNQIDHVVAASSIHHYQPIYSLNEQNWWRHY